MSTTTPNESVIQNVTESKPKRVRKPKVATQEEETPKVKQEKPKSQTTQKTQKTQKKEKAPKAPKVVEEPRSAKRTSARPPKVVEEPESCGVCMDNYTAIIRKKCVCKFCKADTCSKCIERYLLERHEDAHCLHCRVNYNDATLHEICTKTYLQHTYFKHRQEVLINRERANLPGLQDVAIQERKKRVDKEKISALLKEIDEIHKQRDIVLSEYNAIYTQYYSALSASAKMTAEATKTGKIATDDEKMAMNKTNNNLRKKLDEGNKKSEEFRKQIDEKQTKINMIRWPREYGIQGDSSSVKKPEEERKKFIRRCTRDGCQGFLSTQWKCGICEYYSCGNCFATKTKKHDDPHECKKEDVETAEMIKKDSKPCPNCGEFIMKTSGCFAKDTPILMWDGTTKMSQDIKIGDELVGDDGTKRTVLDTTSGVDTMYEVKQSVGMTYVVNSKHTLVLKHNSTIPVTSYNYNKLKVYQKSDGEYHILVDDYIKLDNTAKQVLVGFKVKPYTESSIQVTEVGLGEYFGWKVDLNKKFLLVDSTTLRNCDQMFCISCQTPWSWTSGKVVTSGPIHNPHYYEWMKRNGTAPARNPADIPCGGYPNAWELVRMPNGMRSSGTPFFEFHRICQELQDVSERTYRSHIDQTSTNGINVKFLLGDFDEKYWGQNLGKDERKKKRDREVQEIFAAFRMVAVELINRVQNYRFGSNDRYTFTSLPQPEAEKFLTELYVEIDALIKMINDALRNVSISYSYSVPYIQMDGKYYSIKTKNFSDEVKKKRGKAKEDDSVAEADADEEKVQSETLETVQRNQVIETNNTVQRRKLLSDNYPVDSDSDSDSSSDSEVDEYDEDTAIQLAIQKSLGIQP